MLRKIAGACKCLTAVEARCGARRLQSIEASATSFPPEVLAHVRGDVGAKSETRFGLRAFGCLRHPPKDDFIIGPNRIVPQIELNDSDMIFVGYEVTAPERGRDDYAGIVGARNAFPRDAL